MDWTAIISSIITMALGSGVGVFFTLNSIKKKASAEATSAIDKVWTDRLDQMREELEYVRKQHRDDQEFERKRNNELMQQNIERANEIRRLNGEVISLTKEKASIELRLATVRCDDIECPWRKPPTANTPPPPQITRDEWQTNRDK